MSRTILRIALPLPLRRNFDYLPPIELPAPPQPGQRYQVPFGRNLLVGILIEVTDQSDLPLARLKPASQQLDPQPLLPGSILALLQRAARYYHHPLGEVYASALPVALRKGKGVESVEVSRWRLTDTGAEGDLAVLKRSPKQQQLLTLLRDADQGLSSESLNQRALNWREPMRRLVERNWVVQEGYHPQPQRGSGDDPPPPLHDEQRAASAAVIAGLGGFTTFLLDGVTGSGKTEVYLTVIAEVVARGQQVLVLVPEIGLTPQLLERFRRRFAEPIALLHSGLAEGERLAAWEAARSGTAPIVIGTRSAIFTPLARPGLLIIDEEHDTSFQQQDGFRYSGRDLAVMRGHMEAIPVLLGSATPSLESLANVESGRYTSLPLTERAGGAQPPRLRLLDMRPFNQQHGLSPQLLQTMTEHLAQGNQVLLFLNRRGYAPTLYCNDCGGDSRCPRCDARTTLYAHDSRLRCHHCGHERPVPARCPACGGGNISPIGQGTERIEEAIAAHFPDVPQVRIDRDTTRRKGELEARLQGITSGESRILIGTQMLAKGHHFPRLTLVAVLDADQGLFSIDFRAAERLAQLIVQVAGRAGRERHAGEVVIQTRCPDHPLLLSLLHHDYHQFARIALEERRDALFPPYGYLALLRAEATDERAPYAFLEAAYAAAQQLNIPDVALLGPVPAPMERRAGRIRAQLLLQAEARAPLHRLIDAWLPLLEGSREGRRVRWSLDVDPVEMY